jgi:LPPG:FO 2-phospho-L-lactate transferase
VSGPVVVLSGGTGGAKLARGMLDVVGDDLVVIANTGDDIEIHGAHVSPDPDLVLFWLADRIDARGWGLEGDTFTVMDALRSLGEDVWFNLGDEDLAIGLARARRLADGERLTRVIDDLRIAFGVRARVLPMCDEPVRTWVRSGGRLQPFQEWMIRGGGKGGEFAVEGVELSGADAATLSPEVERVIRDARAVVIGPSNPVISIGPILSVPGMREALQATRAPVVAVSPIVAGRALKGPTIPFMLAAGAVPSAAGVTEIYRGVIDGIVADEPATAVPTHICDLVMSGPRGRERLAREALEFALMLT